LTQPRKVLWRRDKSASSTHDGFSNHRSHGLGTFPQNGFLNGFDTLKVAGGIFKVILTTVAIRRRDVDKARE
jgi:hypothetical protein